MKSKTFTFSSIGLALIALISATTLTLEEIKLWKNPHYVLSCSWNPLFSCQGPMQSAQAHTFIIPNPILGMIGFTLTIAILILSRMTELPRKVWIGYLIGVTFAMSYCMWLMTQTLYEIHALCIYCIIVWACVIPLFWIGIGKFIETYYPDSKVMIIANFRPAIIITHYGIVALMVYLQFHTFFNQLLGLG